jgi:uncharacterized membrane protein YbhN (UPF0104 family)
MLIVSSQTLAVTASRGNLGAVLGYTLLMRPSNIFRWSGIALATAACGWIAWTLFKRPDVADLVGRPKVWPLLAAAGAVATLGQILFYSRWYLLLRVVSVPLSWLDAVSSSAIAELLSHVAFGAAGGDVYRGIATSGAAKGHRVGLVTAILADRAAGLYSIFCLAAIAGPLAPRGTVAWQAILKASLPVLWLAVVGGGLCILAGLAVNLGPALAFTRRWPLVYRAVVPVLAAIERFRSRPWAYAVAILWGIGVHVLNATVLWLVAKGFSLPHPSWAEHCVIMSLATCMGLLPLPMAGLGAVELVIDQLYQAAAPGAHGAGLIAALGYRILSLAVIAALAAGFATALHRRRLEPRDALPTGEAAVTGGLPATAD